MKKSILLLMFFVFYSFGMTSSLHAQVLSGSISCVPGKSYVYTATGFNNLVVWSAANGRVIGSGQTVTVIWDENATLGSITASGNIAIFGNPIPLYTMRTLAVKISSSETPPDSPTFNPVIKSNSSGIVCNNEMINYSLINYDPNASINWVAGNNMTLVSGQNSSNATFRASGNGVGVVKAEASSGGSSTIVENKEVWVGPPMVDPNIGTTFYECPNICIENPYSNNNYIYSIMLPQDGILEYRWEKVIPSSKYNITSQDSYKAFVVPNSVGHIAIQYSAKNTCGWSSSPVIYDFFTESCNQLRNLTSIPKLESQKSNKMNVNNIVKVYSLNGVLVFSSNSIDDNFNIKSLSLTNGVYILETIDENGNAQREKVLIKR